MMVYHIVEEYDIKNKKKIREDFMKKVCAMCSQRYECITHGYRLNVTEKDKFVLIPKEQRKIQVECHSYEKNNS